MAAYSLVGLATTIAWTFDIGGAAALPLWLVALIVVVTGFVLPRLETMRASQIDLASAFEEYERRPFPPFSVWFLQQVSSVGIFAGLMLFAVSSGMVTRDPFTVNAGVRLAVVIVAFSIACASCEPVLDRWISERSARTAAPRPPRRRRRWDGSSRR